MQRYLFALTVLLFSSQLNAVDIQLNNGRIIQADKVWQFANKTHVLRGKQITSLDDAHIKRIITTQHPNSLDTRKPRFEFDRWTSGIDIEDIIDTAREHNLPIKPAGIPYSDKIYDHRTATQYIDTVLTYDYQTTVFDQQATVHLHLTPEHKRLHRIEITWSSSPTLGHEALTASIIKKLSVRYPRIKQPDAANTQDHTWKPNSNTLVTLHTASADQVLKLVYTDKALQTHAGLKTTATSTNPATK